METLELADFIPYYPGSQDENLQRFISEKYEYAELASGTTETPPKKPGEFYKHQKLTHRYLRNYDRLLLMDEPGTGKTCAVLGFTEYVYDQYLLNKEKPELTDPNLSNFKRVYVLVSNKATKENFINQLVCRCSKDGRYLTKGVIEAKNINGQKMALSKAIRNWYRVSTYYGIVKEYEKIIKDIRPEYQDEKVKEHFSNCIFWIDEVHNLTSDSGKVDTDSSIKNWSIEETYKKLLKIVQISDRTKIILSTATPMINETKEFIKIINLLLTYRMPIDLKIEKISQTFSRIFFPSLTYPLTSYTKEQLRESYRGLMPEDTIIDNLTLEELEVYVRGKIIFTKALDTGINIHYRFNPSLDINKNEIIITPNIYISKMGPFQKNSYLNSVKNESASFYSNSRQASNFVFPDGSYGGGVNVDIELKVNKKLEKWQKNNPNATASEISNQRDIINLSFKNVEQKGFSKYINDNKGTFYINNELREAWNTNGLEYYSSKFNVMIEGIKKSTLGTTFVYSEYVSGSGAIVFGLALEHFAGFRRYRPENNAVFLSINPLGLVRNYCGNGDQKRQLTAVAQENINAGVKHYALITGDTVSGSEYNEIIDIFNSPENWNGQLIKTLIVSRIGRVGININNVTRVDLIGPEFNKNNALQANFRALRATGHVELLKNLPLGSRVDVDIFWHASVIDDNLDTSDIQMYLIMEEKAKKISKVMRKLKQCNISCYINKERNQPRNLIDYSADCDYDICNYPCVNSLSEFSEVDYNMDFLTYDLYYSQELLDKLIQVLKYQVFPNHNKATLKEILNYLNDKNVELPDLAKNKKYLILALEQIIGQKQEISNRFNQICYLMEDGDLYYLDNNFPTSIKGVRSLSYYTEKLIVQSIRPIDTIYRSSEEVKLEEILVKLALKNGNLDYLSFEEKNVLQLYRKNIYQMLKPVKILEESYLKIQRSQFSSSSIGRKKTGGPEQILAKNIKNNEIFTNYDPCIPTDSNQYLVYAHNLRSTVLTTSKTAVGTNIARGSGIRRLYDKEKKKWITLYKFSDKTEDEDRYYLEERIYDAIIRKLAKNREEGLPLIRGIYDIKGNKKIFKIINNKHASGAGDKGRSSGRDCRTQNRSILFLLIYYLQVPLENLNLTLIIGVSRSDIISELYSQKDLIVSEEPPFENWDEFKLHYYYTLSKTKFSKNSLCDILEHVMQTQNLIS